jgi:hypothetical protein
MPSKPFPERIVSRYEMVRCSPSYCARLGEPAIFALTAAWGPVQLRTGVCGIGQSFESRTVGAETSVDTLNGAGELPHNKIHGLHRAILAWHASHTRLRLILNCGS